ncbi:MAG: hypothetical protein QW222_03260 [Candidatus Bathyarchaeia archaeon]
MKSPFTSNWLIYKCYNPTNNSDAINENKAEKSLKTHTAQIGTFIYTTPEESKLKIDEFNRLLQEVVDEVFSMLGEPAKQIIYKHLEKKYKISREDIPNKIWMFSDAVEKIFGAGARLIEINIMRRLYEKIDDNFTYYPEREDVAFAQYILALKKHYGQRAISQS